MRLAERVDRAEEPHGQFGQIGRNLSGNWQRRSVAGLLVVKNLPDRAGEWRPARECLVEHDADRVPVRSGRNRFTRGLFRRHVPGRSRNSIETSRLPRLIQFRNQTKIEQDHSAVVANHDVRGFQIAMHNVAGVQRHHAGDELSQRGTQARFVDRTISHITQKIGPFHQIHGEKPVIAICFKRVQSDQIGVIEIDQGAELTLESKERGAVHRGQSFQRNARTASRMHGLVHHAHAAPAEFAHKAVVAKSLHSRQLWRWSGAVIGVAAGHRQRRHVEEHFADHAAVFREQRYIFVQVGMLASGTPAVQLDA